MLPESLLISVRSQYHTQVLLFRSAVPSLSIHFSMSCRMGIIGERRETVRRCEVCRQQEKVRRVSKILRVCRASRRGCKEVDSLCLEFGKWFCMASIGTELSHVAAPGISGTRIGSREDLKHLGRNLDLKEGWLMSSTKSGVSSAAETGSAPKEGGKLARALIAQRQGVRA